MFQFMHIEGYARSASQKSKKSPRTVQQVIDEVLREADSTPHIDAPKPPSFLFGDREAVANIPRDIETSCEKWKAKNGRALRKDAQVLLTVVASFKSPEAGDDPAAWASTYEVWKQKNIEWLRSKWGDKLRAVVLHEDEAHPHIHAYVTQSDDTSPDIRPLHPGASAVAKVGKDATPKQCAEAFKEAMRQEQDSYFQSVGAPCGMTRDGPRKRRESRSEWKARQREAKQVQQYEATTEERIRGTAAEMLIAERKKLRKEFADEKREWAEKVLKASAPELPEPPGAFRALVEGANYAEQIHHCATSDRKKRIAAEELLRQEKEKLKLSETRNGNLTKAYQQVLEERDEALRVTEYLSNARKNLRAAMLGDGWREANLDQIEEEKQPTKSGQPAMDLEDVREWVADQGFSRDEGLSR